ncbi:hypothetical protein [Saccharibacillus sacchari]|uniref:Uncharacterized protein n=1 Tax=Saccharibacillus sacchari TaxID=456493 RepID=A0ACC6P8S1_9BACL
MNGIQDGFFEHDSEIETFGRDSVAVTVKQILYLCQCHNSPGTIAVFASDWIRGILKDGTTAERR